MISSKNEFLFLGQRGVFVFCTLFLWIGSDLLAQCFVPPQAFVATGGSTLSGNGHNVLVKKKNKSNRHDESFLFKMSPLEHISLATTSTTDTTTSIATTTITTATSSDGTLMNIANSMFLLLSEDMDAMVSANAALEGVRIFFTVIGGLVLAFVGLTYATVTFIIPKASEQLERDTKRLRPGLWEEFEAKLGEGETMATRPDLLQELGNIMQPIIMEDFERSANAKDTTATSATGNPVSKKGMLENDNDGNQWKD